MDINHLKEFLVLVETLNYSEAARKLYTSQPSISRHISELEEELQVKLFNRTRKKVELTESGRIFYLKTKEILNSLEKLPELVQDSSPVRQDNIEILNVGITDVLLRIPLHVAAFLYAEEAVTERYPEVRINKVDTHMSVIKNDIKSGIVDLGIVVTDDLANKNLDNLKCRSFYEYQMNLVADKKSGLNKNMTNEEMKEFLSGKTILVRDDRPRVYMQTYNICSELDARPASLSKEIEARVMLNVGRGKAVTFEWNEMVINELSDYLTYIPINVPAANIYLFFCEGKSNIYTDAFMKAYEEYIKREK